MLNNVFNYYAVVKSIHVEYNKSIDTVYYTYFIKKNTKSVK